MLCSATHLLQGLSKALLSKDQQKTNKKFLGSFSRLPLFGEDLGGLRGMLVVVPTPCLHPLHPSTGHSALHAPLCDTGPSPWLSPLCSEVTQAPMVMFHCLQKT